MDSAPLPDNSVDWLQRRRRLESILRLQAAAVMGDPAHEEAIRVLVEAMEDPVADVREIAICALHEFGPEARTAQPELIRAMQDESPVVRRRAVRAIVDVVDLRESNEDVILALLAATEDQDSGVVSQSIASLGEFGPSAAPALTALMSALWTGDARRRALAGVALMRIGPSAIPSVIQSLKHPSAEVRAKAAQVLTKIAAPDEIQTALKPLLEDRDEVVRAIAKESLEAGEKRA